MCGRGDINYSQGMGKGGTKKMEGKASELEKRSLTVKKVCNFFFYIRV